jgi:hypothetical protein
MLECILGVGGIRQTTEGVRGFRERIDIAAYLLTRTKNG